MGGMEAGVAKLNNIHRYCNGFGVKMLASCNIVVVFFSVEIFWNCGGNLKIYRSFGDCIVELVGKS
jgi:hypothetical protein